MTRFTLSVAIVMATTAALEATGPAAKILVLPTENLSGVAGAERALRPDVFRIVQASGYAAVPEEAIEPLLEKEGIRYLDSISGASRERLLAATGASALLLTSIAAFLDGRSPIVAICGRLVESDGRMLWSSVEGLSGFETEGLFQFGRVRDRAGISRLAVERLFRRFPRVGESGRSRAEPATPFGLTRPRTFVSAWLAGEGQRRIALIPFSNHTGVRAATRIVEELLYLRLAESGRFEVVEPADVREALQRGGFSSFRSSDPAIVEAVARDLRCDAILRGSIDGWTEASALNERSRPGADLSLELVDVGQQRIVWTSQLGRQGDDYKRWLQLGAISNVLMLADRMLGEMLRAEGNAKRTPIPVLAPRPVPGLSKERKP
jgi:hypothetical protein